MEKKIANYLALRWMALYMLFCDDDLDRADSALSEKIVELEDKASRTKGFREMTAVQRRDLLNQLLAKEVSSFQEISWKTEPADTVQDLELAVARRVEELSARIESKPAPTGGYKLWARVGISFMLSCDELRQVLTSEDSEEVAGIMQAVLKDGRAVPDGESYIPQSVAERAASWLGEEIPDLDDIEF